MEDLGNIWLRDFFTPSAGGDLSDYFRRYAAKAGLQLDRQKIIYYLVHQLIRGVVFIPHMTRRADWRSTVALNLGYQAISDIVSCDAIGLYHGIEETETESLEIIEDPEAADLYRLITKQLEQGVAPKLNDDYSLSLVAGVADITRYLERRHINGPRADKMKLEGINRLLGESYRELQAARQAFNIELQNMPKTDELAVLEHCWGVARRSEAQLGADGSLSGSLAPMPLGNGRCVTRE